MSLKDELIRFENYIVKENNDDTIDLDKKVDIFIDWFYENRVKGKYTEIGEYHEPITVRNFIEKMAVWYELRYPDCYINKIMPGSSTSRKDINNIMFNNNSYIKELFDVEDDINYLDWSSFYNAHSFISGLPWEEKYLLMKPRYNTIIYLSNDHMDSRLYSTNNGFVYDAMGIYEFSDGKLDNRDIINNRVEKVLDIFRENDIEIDDSNDLIRNINNAKIQKESKERLLDSVMYRIISRGGTRMGSRRAFLFAKEFNRDIDIAMKYGVDRSDPGLRLFINEYIKAGGHKDLECYLGYFSRLNHEEELKTITIEELIKKQSNNAAVFYTPEEDELHQRLVNVLDSLIDHDEVRKEEVKQLRLKKKIEKKDI